MKINFGETNNSGMSVVSNGVLFKVVKLLQVWTILLCFSPSMSGGYIGMTRKPDGYKLMPEFDEFKMRSINATEGQTLLLPCSVRNLGDKVVSWIRSKDLHILTSGPLSFSGDYRFEPVPSPAGDFWGLRIRGVKLSDTGQYECQVNTDPKMSFAINLTVSHPPSPEGTNSKWIGKAVIKGPSKVYARDGSPVSLTCEILPVSLASPQFGAHGVHMTIKPRVRWLVDNKEILFDNNDRRISVDMYYDQMNSIVNSVLKISPVSWRDSGQYTCLQMSVQPDDVWLIVVEGEHSEAMQRDFPLQSKGQRNLLQIIPSILLLFLNLSI